MTESRGAGQQGQHARGEQRMKVLLSAELLLPYGRVTCRVHDLSRGGACLDSPRPLAVGTVVLFERAGLKARARITWSEGSRFGIKFDTPIRATDLLVQMSESRGASRPAPRIPA